MLQEVVWVLRVPRRELHPPLQIFLWTPLLLQTRKFKFFSEADKQCSVCKVLWVMPAVTPESKLINESMDLLQGYMEEIVDSNNEYFHTIGEEVEQQLV